MHGLVKAVYRKRKESGNFNSLRCFPLWCFGLLVVSLIACLLLYNKHGIISISPDNEVRPSDLRISATTSFRPAVSVVSLSKKEKHDVFQATRQKAFEVLHLIYERYEFHNSNGIQLFLMMYNMPEETWDILKYKVALKLLRSGKQDKPKEVFRLIFVGSSVTAGYDNYFNQSYPQIVQQRLEAVFKAANIDLDVRNLGQHRINCMLQTHCLPSLLDISRTDVLGYENSYACGRDPEYYEFMARLAYQYGGVLFVAASGGMLTQSCAPSKDAIPHSAEHWKPLSKINDNVFNESYVASYRHLLSAWHADTFNVGKFTRGLYKPYKGVGIHGFNMFTKSQRLCSYNQLIQAFLTNPSSPPHPQLPGANANPNPAQTPMGGCESSELFNALCVDKGGLQFMTKEASYKGILEAGGRKAAEDGEEGGHVVAKGWNPSRGMHLLRGELMAYAYVLILLDAMDMVERDRNRVRMDDADLILTSSYQAALDKLRGILPKDAVHCPASESAPDRHKPSSPSSPSNPSSPSSSSLPCLLPARTPQCFTLYRPMHTMSTNSLLNITVGSHDGWIVDQFTGGIDMDKYGFKDHKTYFRGVIGGNALHIKILNVRFGVVKLYGLGSDRLRVKGVQIILDPHVPNIRHAQSYTPSNKIVQVNAFAQYDAESDGYEIKGIPKGDHVLTILTPIDATQTEATTLTHVAIY